MKKDIHDYEDIIHRTRPISRKHPTMSRHGRAGQFAPFAALTGLHAAAERVEERNATRYEETYVSISSLDNITKDY